MPNQFFQFADDKEAKQLLFELGLIDKFSKKPIGNDSAAQLVTYGEHLTHFIVAMFFTGKTKPEDNGYVVFCLPKSQYSPERASQFVRLKMEGQGLPVVVKPFSGKSVEN